MVREATAECPAERVRLEEVPVLDEAQDPLAQLGDVVELAVTEQPSLKDAKPDLDLVDPRRVQRRVDEVKASAVSAGELLPLLAVVDVEVVVEALVDVVDVVCAEDVVELAAGDIVVVPCMMMIGFVCPDQYV